MRRLLNDEWEFARLAPGASPDGACWQPVDLPHDFLIKDADDLYADADGWYRRTLTAPEGLGDRVWLLRFDGVYMDCDVLLNGRVLATHRYGYTAFEVDLTDAMRPGDNALEVCVRHRSPNSRWYSGAGIFRDVALCDLPRRHIAPDGIYVRTAPAAEGGAWRVRVDVELEGPGEGGAVRLALSDADGNAVGEAVVRPDSDVASAALTVATPRLWSPDTPYLYALNVAYNGEMETLDVGLRQPRFDPDRGFFLNGEPLKLRGVCLHHDLGALGSAFNADAFRRQLRLMKRMGVNAIRTSHNPPAARALRLCDREGVLVIDEAFDMWRRPKTQYDYARFFDDCWRDDVRAWVRRDRSHPCVIMWSVGNEIFDTHVDPGAPALTAALKAEVEKWDPDMNARVTLGSNYMPWQGGQNCADVVKLAGYNYGEKYYGAHHAAHPDWVIYGSETASILFSRGVYHFPASANAISEEDMQCSALGNSTTSWGSPDMRNCIIDDINNPYSLGQFLWSGTDYIGEPTPYRTRSCYFGMADTAGFPKDVYYQVKALWNPEPMAHIGVSWDWNPGQMIDVPVYANGAKAALFLNGATLGVKDIDLRVPERSAAWWQLPYEPGMLVAVAYDAQGNEIARDSVSSHGDSAALVLSAEAGELTADGESMAFIDVGAVDGDGRPVNNAADRVRVTVEGPIRLLGLDNGDSADLDGYRTDERCLFNGKLLIMLGATDEAGEATVRVGAPGLKGAALKLAVKPGQGRPGHSGRQGVKPSATAEKPVAARRVDLKCVSGSTCLTPEAPEVRFAARLLPECAMPQKIEYRVVNALGIPSPAAKAVPDDGGVTVTALGDGQVYLRAVANNGYPHARVISQIELDITGFGAPGLDPYGFITGGLYDISEGSITSGNEKGIAFARDGESMAGFTRVEFGPVGSDEITIPIFELGGEPVDIDLWMGDPRDGGHVVKRLHYHKKSIWNTYQAETWKLPERFVGEQVVAFSMAHKIHMKGFSFTRQSRAWLPMAAGEADRVVGDSFTRQGGAVLGIGNNVSLTFEHMDFGPGGPVCLTLEGRTPLAVNPVLVRFGDATAQECPFTGDGPAAQTFELNAPAGECAVAFLFLPGCQFDFDRFVFEPIKED